jgi:hypothetical protein
MRVLSQNPALETSNRCPSPTVVARPAASHFGRQYPSDGRVIDGPSALDGAAWQQPLTDRANHDRDSVRRR